MQIISKAETSEFNLHDLRIFTSIPDDRFHGIVALRGLVVIYDNEILHREAIIERGFYVRESQYPAAGYSWESWLEREREDISSRTQPRGRLEVRREVVQAIRWPSDNRWSLRLPSGFVDGPYYDWAFGSDLVGKVVGIYQPN